MKVTLFIATLILGVLTLALPQAQGQGYSQERENGPLQDRLQNNRMRTVPTIPVILNGVEYPAGEFPNTGEPRFYLLTRADQERGVIRAFTSRDRAAEFMRSTAAKGQGNNINTQVMTTSSCQHPFNYSYFNQARFGGDPEDLYMDLDIFTTSIPSHYASLNFGGWNNTISYVQAACNGLWTTLYSCTNFQVSKTSSCQDPEALAIEPGLVVPDLVPYGFNNRTSSIEFLQF